MERKVATIRRALADDARANGLGSRLLAAFEQWAETQGCVSLGLAAGGAKGFYEKHGYGSRAGYYKSA